MRGPGPLRISAPGAEPPDAPRCGGCCGCVGCGLWVVGGVGASPHPAGHAVRGVGRVRRGRASPCIGVPGVCGLVLSGSAPQLCASGGVRGARGASLSVRASSIVPFARAGLALARARLALRTMPGLCPPGPGGRELVRVGLPGWGAAWPIARSSLPSSGPKFLRLGPGFLAWAPVTRACLPCLSAWWPCWPAPCACGELAGSGWRRVVCQAVGAR
jgi:hypothetical protein